MTFVLSPEDLVCPANGKQAYLTEERALTAMKRSWTRRQHHPEREVGKPCRAYLCEDCGWWHLTSRWERP